MVRQGGGVAEILSSLTPLMKDIGIDAERLVIDGSPEFFAITKDIHNGLQGEPVGLSTQAKTLLRDIAHANGGQVTLEDYDVVLVHDRQPVGSSSCGSSSGGPGA